MESLVFQLDVKEEAAKESEAVAVAGTVKPPLHQPAGQAGAQWHGQPAGGGGDWLHHNLHQGEELGRWTDAPEDCDPFKYILSVLTVVLI